jgi:hypothetical protein
VAFSDDAISACRATLQEEQNIAAERPFKNSKSSLLEHIRSGIDRNKSKISIFVPAFCDSSSLSGTLQESISISNPMNPLHGFVQTRARKNNAILPCDIRDDLLISVPAVWQVTHNPKRTYSEASLSKDQNVPWSLGPR